MDPIITEIAPGVRCCAVVAERFKTSRFTLQIALPLRRDTPKNVAARAILPFLLHRSCAALPTPRAVESILAELYGARLSAFVTKFGENQILSISLSALDERFALSDESITREGVAILLEQIFFPLIEGGVFPATSLALEQRLLIEHLESQEGDKWVFAENRLEHFMYDLEDYGINPLGDVDAIRALTPEDVTEAWREMLESAHMLFMIISESDGSAVCDLLRERFCLQKRAPAVLSTKLLPSAVEVRSVREEQPLEQAKLLMGFRAGIDSSDDSPQIHALQIMTDLFGGGTYSKLFLNVRETLGLCYHCSARFSQFKGVIVVRSGVDTDKAERAKEAILAQLQELQQGNFTEEELLISKRFFRDSLSGVEDAQSSIVAFYSTNVVEGSFITPQKHMEQLERVTREDVIAAAQGVTLDTVYLLAGNQEGSSI